MAPRFCQSFLSVVVIVIYLVCGTREEDLTITENAHGSDVVNAVVDRITASCVFPEDKLLTRRMAYTESEDGDHPNTFRPGYDGGIWQVCMLPIFYLTLHFGICLYSYYIVRTELNCVWYANLFGQHSYFSENLRFCVRSFFPCISCDIRTDVRT